MQTKDLSGCICVCIKGKMLPRMLYYDTAILKEVSEKKKGAVLCWYNFTPCATNPHRSASTLPYQVIPRRKNRMTNPFFLKGIREVYLLPKDEVD